MKKIPKLVILGASGHALVVADIVRLQGQYEIVGFLDNINLQRKNNEFAGATILGGYEQLDRLKANGVNYIILGFGDCKARLELAEFLTSKSFLFATASHPSVVVASDVRIGSGSVLMAGSVLNPGVRVGKNVIVNTCASIDHECILNDAVHISPGVCLAGCVQVGKAAWVGINATIAEGIKIGAGSIIGAGSVVLNDIPTGVLAYGIPATVVREINTL